MYTTQIDHMNLHQIANSGQCFRWQQINDNTYKIPTFGKELTISQDGNTFILSCDENEWNSLWRNYFDLETNYNEVENIIMESNDDFLKAAYQFGSGFNDSQREYFANHPEKIIGKIVSVKYKEETQNKDGGKSLQFPVYMGILIDRDKAIDE